MSHKKRGDKPIKTASGAESPINANRHSNDQQQKPEKRFWRDYEPMEKFNFVLATFTVIYAVVSIGLYVIARSDLRIARNSLVDVQRAFVFVAGVEMMRTAPQYVQTLPKTAASSAIVVHFENSGSTPAPKSQMLNNLCFRDDPVPDNFSYPNFAQKPQTFLISPKAQFTSPLAASASDIEATMNASKKLYVWGTLTYEDIFQNWHQTQYCFYFSGYVLDKTTDHISWNFNECERHNCADQDCPESWGDNPDTSACRPPN